MMKRRRSIIDERTGGAERLEDMASLYRAAFKGGDVSAFM
jgi:hypothetical protein